MQILQSASKVVLIAFALTACASFLAVVFSNLSSDQIVNSVTTIFTTAAGSVLTYYFTRRSQKEGDGTV